jgi:hypothetical protein
MSAARIGHTQERSPIKAAARSEPVVSHGHCTSADQVRFSRPDTPRPLNFGAGTHYSVGQALAKVAVEKCVRAVLAADLPLRLTDDPADIAWRQVLGRSPARLVAHDWLGRRRGNPKTYGWRRLGRRSLTRWLPLSASPAENQVGLPGFRARLPHGL